MVFLRYAVGIIIRPTETLRVLGEDANRFRIGLASVVALALLYSITLLRLYSQGIPVVSPLLAIPPSRYYLYEAFFLLPVSLAGWLLMGTTIYLFGPSTQPEFKRLLALLGLPYGILVLPFMWLPETIVAFAHPEVWTARWWVSLTPVRVTLGTLWVLGGCVEATRQHCQLPMLRSVLLALTGLVAALALSFVFIR
jgi:hypothetical protein